MEPRIPRTIWRPRWAPMLELIDTGKQTIASVMNEAGRAVAELLLKLSAQQIAGPKRSGRHASEVLWHGSQGGQICLLVRKRLIEAISSSEKLVDVC